MSAPIAVIAAIEKNARESIRVAIDEWKGSTLIDIRVVVPLTSGAGLVPTGKGVSLRIDRLPELVRALQDAEAKARELGLLGRGPSP